MLQELQRLLPESDCAGLDLESLAAAASDAIQELCFGSCLGPSMEEVIKTSPKFSFCYKYVLPISKAPKRGP